MRESAPATAGPEFRPHEESSELREYLAVLRTRKWSIIAITALTLLAALFFSFRQTPIYESEAQVLVNPIPPSGFQTVLAAAPNLDTERTVASSTEVAELAADRLGGSHDPQLLLEELSVEVATNSEVLIFRYADPSPLEAQRRAQAFSQAYLAFRREKALESLIAAQESTQQQIDDVSQQLRRVSQQLAVAEDEVQQANLQTRASGLAARLAVLEQEASETASVGELRVADIIAQADLPSSPASPNHILNGALALLVGLALGVGLAFLRERLDDRLRGQGDLEARAGAPVLAVVPRIPNWKKAGETPLVAVTEPKSGAAEAYRTLRTSLLFAAAERDLKVIMITSPHPGEGKTATTANLAAVLAQAGKRVVAISADLRKPRLHRFFGASNGSGLSRLLTGEDGFKKAVQKVGVPNLRIVASGPVPKNPAELVGSHAMGKALERFRDAADVVLIDAAPVLDVADTITMAPFTDAVVLVADAEKTSRSALSHARKQLDQVKAEVVGAVLNNLDPSKARAYPYYYRYYYRYYYQYADREDGRERGRGRRPAAQEAPSLPPAWEEWTWDQGTPERTSSVSSPEPPPIERRAASEGAPADTPERERQGPPSAAEPTVAPPPPPLDLPLAPPVPSVRAQARAEPPVAEPGGQAVPAEPPPQEQEELERIWASRQPAAERKNGEYTAAEAAFFPAANPEPDVDRTASSGERLASGDAAERADEGAERSGDGPAASDSTPPTERQ